MTGEHTSDERHGRAAAIEYERERQAVLRGGICGGCMRTLRNGMCPSCCMGQPDEVPHG